MAGWIEGPLAHMGIVSDTAVTSLSYAMAFAVITFIDIVFGELVPKYFAIRRPKTVALLFSAPLIVFLYRGLSVHLDAQSHGEPVADVDGNSADQGIRPRH